jgi:hypothetical protein
MEISIKEMPPLERQFEVKFYATVAELKSLANVMVSMREEDRVAIDLLKAINEVLYKK